MFWVNVPFCVVGLLLAWRHIPADSPARPSPGRTLDLDVPGLLPPAPGTAVILRAWPTRAPPPGSPTPTSSSRWPSASCSSPRSPGTPCAHRPLVDVRLLAQPPGRLVQRGAVLLRLLPLRRHAPAAAVLPGRTRRPPRCRRSHARPAGHRRPLSRNRRRTATSTSSGRRAIALAGLRHRRRLDRSVRLRRDDTSAWLLAFWMVDPRVRPRRRHHAGDGGRYIGLDKQQIPHSSVLTRTAQQIGGSFGTAVLAVILSGAIAAPPGNLADRVPHGVLVGRRASPPSPCCSPCGSPAPAVPPAGPGQHATAHPGHQWPVHILTDGTWR